MSDGAIVVTTHKGRPLNSAEVRAAVMSELCLWRQTWPSIVGTLDQRRRMAGEFLASRDFRRCDGCVARPVVGDAVLSFLLVRVAEGS